MKLIRCTVPLFLEEQLVDLLKVQGDVASLTVTGGAGWNPRQPVRKHVYRACEYQERLHQGITIDVTAPDYAVDDVVKIVVDSCGAGGAEDNSQILVMAVEDWHEVRARRRQIA